MFIAERLSSVMSAIRLRTPNGYLSGAYPAEALLDSNAALAKIANAPERPGIVEFVESTSGHSTSGWFDDACGLDEVVDQVFQELLATAGIRFDIFLLPDVRIKLFEAYFAFFDFFADT